MDQTSTVGIPVICYDEDIMRRNLEMLDGEMAAIFRAKSPAERLAIAWRMWKSARDMLSNLTRAEHPSWSEVEVRREVSRRLSHGAR